MLLWQKIYIKLSLKKLELVLFRGKSLNHFLFLCTLNKLKQILEKNFLKFFLENVNNIFYIGNS